ncbi:hypothetical protein HPP92_002410 [Vanilla planifolia]|uniref:Uncharacterized protein n=1 Tax=Vanilla planifolia TaxID=51239 RepID=A0A835SEM4_VANPL|nr:hypothetical protein HPP92_002410 [Vanilla planifolia]
MNHIDKEEAATGKGYTKGKSRGRSKKAAKQASASRYKLKKSAVKDKFDKTSLETVVQGAETNFHSECDLQGNNLIPSSTCNVDNGFIQLHSQDSSVSEFTETKPVAHIHFYALEKMSLYLIFGNLVSLLFFIQI